MRRILVLALLVANSCYLPQATTTLPVENQVQVAVYRCTAELVGGDILNNATVPIEITVKAKWLDNQSEVFHEEDVGPFRVEEKGTLPWEAISTEEVDEPALCQGETVSVVEAES